MAKLVCISLVALGFGGDDTHVDTEPIAAAPPDSSEPRVEPPPASEPGPTGLAPTAGGVLAVDRHGLLVVERSAGELVRADRDGRRRASVKLGPGLGELVLDGLGHATLADRSGDRVIRFDVDHPD
ncbi:MAG TPA: hypothetical protein VK034_28455, partial [Enhygromyxa sp.]|nr:hypothetical protein [Enhygromyxa sp.]